MGTYLGGVVAHSGESVPWLAIDPGSGAVPTNSSTPIDITFDAGGIQPGLHQAGLLVVSNDPALPFMEIPSEMQVEPTADMGQVSGTVSDTWTGEPLAASVTLVGVHAGLASPSYEIWAEAGSYTLSASKDGYVTRELSIDITAGANTAQDIDLEPDLARMELDPEILNGKTIEGSTTAAALNIANTGPALLEVSIHELPSFAKRFGITLAGDENPKILYDRAHNEPPLSEFTTLVDDLTAAGATVDQNYVYPIDAAVLDGYDVLWINCCGYTNWTYYELNALKSWLDDGGAILIHGGESPATNGPASIYGIKHQSSCSYGTSTDIKEHPITVDVSRVYVDTCFYLTFGSSSILAVLDTSGQPHVVAHEQDRGKMVVVSGADFSSWAIDQEDNRVLAHNVFGWLAEPGYEDISWLRADPAVAQIPGHSSQEVTIQFDASKLHNGVYEAFLAVEHNDPNRASPVKLPVTFTVGKAVGRLLVDKNSNPSGSTQIFSFTLAGGPDDVDIDFTLSDKATPWDSGLLTPGAYNLMEKVPAGWVQSATACDDGSDPSKIQLGQGETLTCTFSNRKLIQPDADFSASPISGAPPLNVHFTNLATGDFSSCLWDFGDNSTSALCNNPSHTYGKSGAFTVSLHVQGSGGKATMTKVNFITTYVQPIADFTHSITSGVPPLIVDFTNLSTGDFDKCLWNFGDGITTTTCGNPSHAYRDEGHYTVTLTVEGFGGEDQLSVERCVKVAYYRIFIPGALGLE